MRFILPLTLALLGSTATAAVVAEGTTKVGDTNNIELVGGTSVDGYVGRGVKYNRSTVFKKLYAQDAIGDWVWSNEGENSSVTYQFSFDLTGYDLSTAVLTGNFAVDNYGSVKLNGTTLLDMPYENNKSDAAHFRQMNPFGNVDQSLFNAGSNLLTFEGTDAGFYWGLSADVTVTADASPVPLPAALPMLLASIGGLAMLRRK